MINEKVFRGKKYVHIHNGHKDLLIVLNTHNQGDRYFGYKTICESANNVDVLFIVDPNNKYYLDDNNGQDYKDLIGSILGGYEPSRVSIFGTSMAGYAALFLGLEFSLDIISINPQINLDSAQELAWPKLKETLSNLDSKINIEALFKEKYAGQVLFFVFGQHRLDRQAYREFLSLDLEDVGYYVKRVNSLEHKFFLSDLSYLENIHFLCKDLAQINNAIRP